MGRAGQKTDEMQDRGGHARRGPDQKSLAWCREDAARHVRGGLRSNWIGALTAGACPLIQNLKHMNMEMRVVKSPKGNKVKFAVWHGGRKHVAQLRTAKAAVANMIKGLTVGWQYKMRAVYAHFPINVIIAGDGTSAEIR